MYLVDFFWCLNVFIVYLVKKVKHKILNKKLFAPQSTLNLKLHNYETNSSPYSVAGCNGLRHEFLL